MKRYNIIEVSYMAATNTKPARIKLYSHSLQCQAIYSFGYGSDTASEQAWKILCEQGFNITGICMTKAGCGLISDTFKEFGYKKIIKSKE